MLPDKSKTCRFLGTGLTKWISLLVLVTLYTSASDGQEIEINPNVAPQQEQREIEPGYISPDMEVRDANIFLSKIDEEDRPFIRFFTTYAYPKDKRDELVYALSFVLHSLAGVTEKDDDLYGTYAPLAIRQPDGTMLPYKLVPGSETLWWIDIREFSWTIDAIEAVSSEDIYFVEPVIRHSNYSLLRLLAGNAVFRADWFVREASDTMKQVDNFSGVIIYRTLLYCNVDEPFTDAEFRDVWGLNLEVAEGLGNQSAVLVTKSKAVARHNRHIFAYKTHFGWLYETFDVFNESGLRNYPESFVIFKGKRPFRDAAEIFAVNQFGLYVYDLINGNVFDDPNDDVLANDAAAGVARHMADVAGDVRVRVAHSCFDCHSVGPLMPENTVAEYLGTIHFPEKEDAFRVQRTYLDGVLEATIVESQAAYARAVKRVNGLSPQENAQAYLSVVGWYEQPVDIKQAAWECGVSEAKFINELRKTQILPARLALMLNGEACSRDAWAAQPRDGIPPIFQQAMVMIHGVTQISTENNQQQQFAPRDTVISEFNTTPQILPPPTNAILEFPQGQQKPKDFNKQSVKAIRDGVLLYAGGRPVVTLKKGEKVGIVAQDAEWLVVRYNDRTFFVNKRDVE